LKHEFKALLSKEAQCLELGETVSLHASGLFYELVPCQANELKVKISKLRTSLNEHRENRTIEGPEASNIAKSLEQAKQVCQALLLCRSAVIGFSFWLQAHDAAVGSLKPLRGRLSRSLACTAKRRRPNFSVLFVVLPQTRSSRGVSVICMRMPS
jgi:hypothetical protein